MANDSNKVVPMDDFRKVNYGRDVPSISESENRLKILKHDIPATLIEGLNDTMELIEVSYSKMENKNEKNSKKEGSDMRKDEFDERFDMHKELMESKFDNKTAALENKVSNLEKSIDSLATDIEKKIESSFASLESKIEANSSKLLLDLHKTQTEEFNKVRTERKEDRKFVITTGIAIASLAVAALTIILT